MHLLAAHTHWTFVTRVGCAQTQESLGRLRGQAAVARTPSGGIDVREQGVWEADSSKTISPGMPAAGTRATNRWRAIPMDRGWRIEHLRLGEPVTLVELERAEPNAVSASEPKYWVSRVPHPCGEDTYELIATCTSGPSLTITLRWTVLGPSKAQVLTTTYAPGGG